MQSRGYLCQTDRHAGTKIEYGIGALPKYAGHKLVIKLPMEATSSWLWFHLFGFFRMVLYPCRPSALTGLQDARMALRC